VRLAAALAVGVLVVGGCGGGRTTVRAWCEGHLQAVAQVGIHQGTHFDFGTARAAIEWPEFAADSEFERPIILAESLNGPDIYDVACRDAYQAK
jgi:hypothetical protein